VPSATYHSCGANRLFVVSVGIRHQLSEGIHAMKKKTAATKPATKAKPAATPKGKK
jgi:hypothetical protein